MANSPRSNAWQRRQASEQRAAASRAARQGVNPGGGFRTSNLGGGDNPIPIVIESGSPQFLNALSQSMGFSSSSGSTPGNDPASSMNAVLNSATSIAQAATQIVTDMRVAGDMLRQFTADQTRFANDMRTARQAESAHMAQILGQLVSASVNMGGGGPGFGGGGGPGPAPIPTPAPGPPPAIPTPSGGTSTYLGAGQTTLGGLRSRITSYAHNNFGAGANTPDLREERDDQGNVTGYQYRPNATAPWQSVAANSRRVPGLLRSAGQRGMVSSIASGFSRGGFKGAARAVPYLGTAVAVVEGVNDAAIWGTKQREANARYQSIYGSENFDLSEAISSGIGITGGEDGTNRSGLASRLQEQGYMLGQRFSLGGMTEDQSREAFRGVSSLGYDSTKRSQSLDFISSSYKKLGMSVQESLQLVQISAQHANSSLGGVAKGLQTVTEAAVATGQNANMLRQSFAANYGAVLGAGGGAGSGALATAFTMSGAGVSRDLSGLNYAGVLQNPGMVNLLAGSSGRTAGQLLSEVNSGNIRALTAPLQQRMDQSMTSTMSQSVRNDLRNLVEKNGGNKVVGKSQGAQRAIALQLMKNRGWNIYTARQALANIVGDTSGMDDVQVAEAFVANLSGAGVDAQAQEAEKQNQITNLSDEDKKRMDQFGLPSRFVEGMQDKRAEQRSFSDVFGSISEAFGGTSAELNSQRALSTNANAYSEYQKNSKTSNPAIEAMLTKFGGNTDARIQVQTKQGPRVVTIDEAIKHFSDQISSGQAIVMNAGDESGKAISEVTGVRVGGFKAGQNGTIDSTMKDAPVGQSIDDWNKAHPAGSSSAGVGGATGTVNISLTPEVARIFQFTSTGGVNIQGAAASGRPPVPSTGPR